MRSVMSWLSPIVALVAVGALAGLVVKAYLALRGTRLVACPETQEPAAVKIDLRYAALTSAFGQPHLRLKDCSRWPERRRCGQTCLMALEAAPHDCLVRTIVGKWYEGKTCAYCGLAIGPVRWHDHRPALLSAEGLTLQWNEVRPETLPRVLATHRPVCWNCHIAESFRREHPELVIDAPESRVRPQARA